MGVSDIDEQFKRVFDLFVHEVTTALAIPVSGSGSTTWKRPEVAGGGLEADQCYHFRPREDRRRRRGPRRWSMDIADYPNPDLASRSTSRRPGGSRGHLQEPASRRRSGGSMEKM